MSRASLTQDPAFGIRSNEVGAFEAWLRQRYSLDSRATWIALDRENRLIASGIQVPTPKEFDEKLEQGGLKNPLKIARAFLTENPDHLDAKGDLLTEARRRALRVMPSGVTEDLDTETDLRAWGVMANETDKVFSAPWLGVSFRFFRPDQEQPERHSKLMKKVFRKHIGAVESAIRLYPSDASLWNIWTWMARSLADYKWDAFVDSIEPFNFPYSSCPSPDVCVWFIEEYRQKNDWEAVLKYAKTARGFSKIYNGPIIGWIPSYTTKFENDVFIKDYPVKSAYAPHLEALLRLGRVSEANDIYDEMIRVEGKTGRTLQNRSNNALIAASVAKSLEMEELAKIWEHGQQIAKTPYLIMPFSGFPKFYTSARMNSDYYNFIAQIAGQLSPSLSVSTGPESGENLPWEQEDGKERWALLSGDQRILAYDTSMPKLYELQEVLNRQNIKSSQNNCRSYISEHGTQPGLELYLAFEIIKDNIRLLSDTSSSASLNNEQLESRWGEASSLLNRILGNNPETLFNMPYIYDDVPINNESMKSLSKRILENIEKLLTKRPSLEQLWYQWFFWRRVEGLDRPIEPLFETIKPSPLAMPGSIPPAIALDSYFAECRKNGQWPKVIKLLRDVWDREFARIERYRREKQDSSSASSSPKDTNAAIAEWYDTYIYNKNSETLGNNVGTPLIEAYLNANNPFEAGEIFNAWLSSGGRFADISKILELAKEKGQERLAREWEAKVK
ncbi:MAG: hypothetical protein LBH03_02495 [Holophagales bacterium]|nr:hypothetical protein [Holophagales bacterium]